jgi:hypothetical protein
MLRETGKRMTVCGILVVTAAVGLTAWPPATAAEAPPKPLKSGIVSFDDAPAHQADWGEMRRYFTGETAGTKDVLTAVAIVKPGKAVHRAHLHPFPYLSYLSVVHTYFSSLELKTPIPSIPLER